MRYLQTYKKSILRSNFLPIDPLGQPKLTAGRDYCFRTCCPYVRTSPLFKSSKTKQQKTIFATGVIIWAWPSGSLMTPPFLFFYFFVRQLLSFKFCHHHCEVTNRITHFLNPLSERGLLNLTPDFRSEF